MFCIKCGKQLSDDMAFCPSCGNKIADNAPYQAAPAQAANNIPHQPALRQTAKKPSKIKIIIIAVAVIAAVLIVLPRFMSRITNTMEKSLAGTWAAPFADGQFECRLLFTDSTDFGSAMLLRFDERGRCIGYFEAIYRGEVEFTKENEGHGKIISGIITMENVSDKDHHEHDYELPYMTIQYDYDTRTGNLTLESDFLSNYFNKIADDLTFERMDNDEYYPKTGERYYDWNLFY